MLCNNSPLDTLASLFIAFAAGVLTVVVMSSYIAEIKSHPYPPKRAP